MFQKGIFPNSFFDTMFSKIFACQLSQRSSDCIWNMLLYAITQKKVIYVTLIVCTQWNSSNRLVRLPLGESLKYVQVHISFKQYCLPWLTTLFLWGESKSVKGEHKNLQRSLSTSHQQVYQPTCTCTIYFLPPPLNRMKGQAVHLHTASLLHNFVLETVLSFSSLWLSRL